ncbi:unnamed protein product [Sphenostylis stenocarpa]|uniref:YLP motif-containing protein 1 n=1 Tax=Sphenostylis stenocarpa TaxID=92480 RepID=A0AA86SDZ1_9FABA|nr:unnamed protein product [Sphenostylis stenocarpa]
MFNTYICIGCFGNNHNHLTAAVVSNDPSIVQPKYKEECFSSLIKPLVGWNILPADAEIIDINKRLFTQLNAKFMNTNNLDKGEFISSLNSYVENIRDKHAWDLGSSEILTILRYCLSPSKDAYDSMVTVKLEWESQAVLASSVLHLKACDWVPKLEDVIKYLGLMLDEKFPSLVLHPLFHEELISIEEVVSCLNAEAKFCHLIFSRAKSNVLLRKSSVAVTMDHRQWRPTPPPNLCPTCFLSHFPFCPPPPPYHPHPFPPDHTHQPPLPYAPANPNFPNFKRPRIHDNNDSNNNPLNFSDDQRRLQLIRDHGTNPSHLHPHAPHQPQHTQNAFPPHDAVPPHQPHNAQFRPSPQPFHPYPEPSQRLPDASAATYHHAHAPHVGMQPPPPHVNFPSHEGNHHNHHQLNGSVGHYPYPYPASNHSNNSCDNNMEASRFFRGHSQPPLPSSPPPPLPMEPSMNQLKTYFSPPKKPASLFPVHLSSSPSSYSQVSEPHSLPQPYYPTGFPSEACFSFFSVFDPSKQYLGDSQPFSLNQFSADRPKFIDASHLFRHPHRASRPDHFVIIFRGLPGSGKSYLAKMLRDLEVENGGDAPRIHSMDDYFMTEVEKVEDSESSKSSSSGRNKKPVTKKVMEYCYEPEMEEAYRSSMLKAFKKTVEEGVFTFIIVDDRNLRVADFAQFWATAKLSPCSIALGVGSSSFSGVTLLHSYLIAIPIRLFTNLTPIMRLSMTHVMHKAVKDEKIGGCAARNVHGFTQEDIEKMSKQWEEAPSLYLQLDVKSLFHGDDLKESRIQEVDMDMEDDLGDVKPPVQGREAEKIVDPPVGEDASFLKAGKNWGAEGEHPTEVRELGKSKWSEDFGEDDIDQTEGMKGNINALSGLIHQYGKERKSVHWGDQGGRPGFSIGAARKVNALSIVIGPGAGYNLKSNPLPEEDSPSRNSVESKKHSIFQERIRAERESFKAVFDRRRHRIGGLDVEED